VLIKLSKVLLNFIKLVHILFSLRFGLIFKVLKSPIRVIDVLFKLFELISLPL